jgi:hypothetical protein
MLQLQPEKEIVYEFIRNEDFKYLRALGAFYLRLVGKPVEIYTHLEPLYNDYRKLAYRSVSGWATKHVDEFIDEVLTSEVLCDIALPFLPKRSKLEDQGLLKPRVSALDSELFDGDEDDEDEEGKKEEEQQQQQQQQEEEGQQQQEEEGQAQAGAKRQAPWPAQQEDDEEEKPLAPPIPTPAPASALAPASAPAPASALAPALASAPASTLASAPDADAVARKAAAAEAKFDRMFKKKPSSSSSSSSSSSAAAPPAPAPDSVAAWNAQRAALGLKPLRE